MDTIQKSQSRLQSNTNMQAARSLIKKANASNQPISLAKNEIIRGLVTDLRPGFVKLKLANRQTVIAELEGTNEVSIGDVAAFKITENNGSKMILKKLNTNVSAEDQAITKALEEAELPINEINHQVVKELLYHKLPINKEMINQILVKGEQYPNADIDTIVYLIKNGVNLEEDYLAKFDEYKQFSHHLMSHIDEIGSELDILIKSAAIRENATTFLSLVTAVFDLLDITPAELLTEELPEDGTELAPDLMEENSDEVLEDNASFTNMKESTGNDLPISLSGREQKQLLKLLSSLDLGEDYIASIQDGTASLRETVQHLSEAITTVSTTAPEELAQFRTPLVFDLLDQFHQFQMENEELASLLNTTERKELLDAMADLPLSIKDAALISNGEMTQGEFCSLLAAFATPEYDQSLRSILGKHSLTKILGKAMENIFTVTPQQLSEDPDSITKLYNSLADKMEDLAKITSATANELNNPHLSEKMNGLKQNLDFMQDFNKLFTYIQLPVKLKEQVTHGDLYVYTNKKKLASGTKDISVLLHLDMDHLGPLDIHLSLTAQNVHTKFYVQDKETRALLQKNSGNLRTVLAEKGFSISTEFYEQQKEVNIIKDIVDQEAKSAPIKRYSFDIRA
ncbi:MAG: flagellar hook-length control protein FliK [bacterium]|nr:flagellar hook-length control protein FliK [bacterium]